MCGCMRGVLELVRFLRKGAAAIGLGVSEARRLGVDDRLEGPSVNLLRPRDMARVFSVTEACTEKGKQRREVSSGLR